MARRENKIASAERYTLLRDEYERMTNRGDRIEPKLASCRKKLYVASLISIGLNVTGTVPEKISALGIELKQFQQEKLTLLLGLICLYFLIEFIAIVARERYFIKSSFGIEYNLEKFRRQMNFDSGDRFYWRGGRNISLIIWRFLDPLIYYVRPFIVGIYGVIAAMYWSSMPNWLKI
jgi:hypothetical protein